MNKMLNRGKVLITYVSVLAILAVSVLSVFAGVSFNAFAEEGTGDAETTVTYPLNGKYDADYVEVKTPGISYEAVDTSKKTKTDNFTGFDIYFCVDPNTEGNGTAGSPYIIKTANQFAAVVTCNLKDENDNWIDTEGLYFKIADDIRGFNLNNTGSNVDFSDDSLTSAKVEAALKTAEVPTELKWQHKSGIPFKGRFDGNGACVYGLKADSGYAAIFPKIGGNITVKNLTVKNCYFTGTDVSAFFASNQNPGQTSALNTKHYMYNCQAYGNVLVCTYTAGEAIQKCGILIAQTSGYTSSAGWFNTETCLVVSDCLVYDNIAKHAENDDDNPDNRNITYGLVGNLHRSGSLTINNSIIMDAVPHALYYGSNAHFTSSYHNLYTNVMGDVFENIDLDSSGVPIKYVYTYKVENGTPRVGFNHYKNGENLTNKGNGYDRTLSGSVVYKTTVNEVKTSKALDGIDSERWTYNANGYPTPKIYKVREYSGGTNWSGEQAVQFGEGDGSESAPFTVACAEELVLMLTQPVTGAYYKLIADIEINDTSIENWTEKAKTWFTSNDVPTFEASLDGNGYTVSGIYYDGSQVGEYAGLIPVVGNTAEIRDITIANSVINANKGAAGGIAGTVADRCSKLIKFDACIVEDTVKFNGTAVFGGMIGRIGYSVVQINDCISQSNGLFNNVTGEAKVKRSVSVGAYPFANIDSVRVENVYTDTEGATLEGITVVPNDAMLGESAANSMPGLVFPTSWIVTEGYPKPTGTVASAEGVVGEPWTGDIATGFARGTGTEEDPYIIETPEQLAYFITKVKRDDANFKYYQLGADIYLNDVNSKLWSEKIGCIDWFDQYVNYNQHAYLDFNGDGYVIYGLYFDSTNSTGPYVRVGLFPMLGKYSTIRNVGLSNVYINCRSSGDIQDTAAGFVGCIEDFDAFLSLDSHDAEGNKEKLANPENDYENMAVKIQNCFIDHNSYISAYFTGGFFGNPYSAPILENCIFTGSIGGNEDQYYTGALTGADSTYGSQLRGCIVFPSTDKVNIVGGSGGSSWRSNASYWVTTADPVYYFNLKQQYGADYTKINRPDQRFGEAAKEAMPLLDWAGDSDDGTGDYWTVVDGGTPLPTIFTKHRTQEEFEALSCKKFDTPSVTVSFVTGTPEITIPDLVGEMYTKEDFVLPELERLGFEFTGWYVFSDYSIEYPYDYFPPRDIVLYAGWNQMGVVQDFEQYPDTIWDYDEEYWILNKPGVKGGYKNKYVRNGSKSMHLLGNNPESSDCLLNYEEMLVPGTAYTITFWVTTDNDNNPPTLLSLVHNSYPDYLDTGIAMENMAVVTGLKDGEWTQYSYSFTAKTQWVSIRATGNSSLYFDDIVMASLDGVLSDGKVINLNNGVMSPATSDSVSVAVMISVIMACATVAVISRKNLVEVIEE